MYILPHVTTFMRGTCEQNDKHLSRLQMSVCKCAKPHRVTYLKRARGVVIRTWHKCCVNGRMELLSLREISKLDALPPLGISKWRRHMFLFPSNISQYYSLAPSAPALNTLKSSLKCKNKLPFFYYCPSSRTPKKIKSSLWPFAIVVFSADNHASPWKISLWRPWAIHLLCPHNHILLTPSLLYQNLIRFDNNHNFKNFIISNLS